MAKCLDCDQPARRRRSACGITPVLCEPCYAARRAKAHAAWYERNKVEQSAKQKRYYDANAGRLRLRSKAKAEARERGITVEEVLREWHA